MAAARGMQRVEADVGALMGGSERYRILERIGEGSFGEVHKAIEIATGKIVALKRVRLRNVEDGEPLDRSLACVCHANPCVRRSSKHGNERDAGAAGVGAPPRAREHGSPGRLLVPCAYSVFNFRW